VKRLLLFAMVLFAASSAATPPRQAVSPPAGYRRQHSRRAVATAALRPWSTESSSHFKERGSGQNDLTLPIFPN